ncbi:type VI secretion system-associated protein [Enterovibrio norvegicus]|uniref:type VI secretion system baseplate subunit TssK n=1 Tax=Enterovibrio norvegicus TaxID=188144 RepID=UPI0003041FF3|nr:type VI secretion system baseplate subunit TssK [Enterovibrio norvegicus]OEE49617.1 type VI secretion system-associated protein [Enterovibrio norvegicus]
MDKITPVYWHQGMLLQPQHFQMESQYLQSRQNRIDQLTRNEHWGLKDIHIQVDELEQGRLVVSSGEFFFPEGSVFRVPQEATVLTRVLDDESIPSGRTTNIYLGIKRWQREGANADEMARDQLSNALESRFYIPEDVDSVPDLYGKGLNADVRSMKFLVKIFFESELEHISDYDLLPIARLEHEGGAFRLVSSYVPPLINVQHSQRLKAQLTDIRDHILMRAKHIERFKPTAEELLEQGGNDFGLTLVLGVLVECAWKIQDVTETPILHPRKAWSDVCSIVAKLSSFVSQLSVVGEPGRERWPEYDHENLSQIFDELQTQIKQALNTITVGPQHVIRFSQQQETWYCQIEEDAFNEDYQFWLLFEGQHREDIEEALSHLIKLAPESMLSTILMRALSGIPLQPHSTSPRGLPKEEQGVYCEIDVSHELWQETVEEGQLALFWPTDEGAQVTLYVLRK